MKTNLKWVRTLVFLTAALLGASVATAQTLFNLSPTQNSWRGGNVTLSVAKNTLHPLQGSTTITRVDFYYNAVEARSSTATFISFDNTSPSFSAVFNSTVPVPTSNIDDEFYLIAKVTYTQGGPSLVLWIGDLDNPDPNHPAHRIRIDNQRPSMGGTLKTIGRFVGDADPYTHNRYQTVPPAVPTSEAYNDIYLNAANFMVGDIYEEQFAIGTHTRMYVCSTVIPLTWVPPNTADDGLGSGIAGYHITWGQGPPTLYTMPSAPNTPVYDSKVLATLTQGDTFSNQTAYWVHIVTFDNAGNATSPIHYGPIWLISSPTVVCPKDGDADSPLNGCDGAITGIQVEVPLDPGPGTKTITIPFDLVMADDPETLPDESNSFVLFQLLGGDVYYPGVASADLTTFGITVTLLSTSISGTGSPDDPWRYELTYQVSDSCGNTSEICVWTVYFADTEPPEIDCPTPADLEAGTDCLAELPDYTGLADVDDNCGVDRVEQSPAPGTRVADGTTVTLAVYDTSGNSASCSFEVTVVDRTDPTIDCPTPADLEAGADCLAELPDYTGLADVDDNCGVDRVEQSPAPGTRVADGTTVTLTVYDTSENSATCSFQVRVVDRTPPVISGCDEEEIVEVDAGVDCLYVVPAFDGITAEDNCDLDPIRSVVVIGDGIEATTGDGIPPGIYSVCVNFMDASGNQSQCCFTLVVHAVPIELICWEGDEAEFTVPVNPDTCEGEVPDFCALLAEQDRIVNPCDSQFSCWQEPAAGTPIVAGSPVTVTIYVMDLGGQTAQQPVSCTVTVSVKNLLWLEVMSCDQPNDEGSAYNIWDNPLGFPSNDGRQPTVSEGNIVRLQVWYACEPLQELLFTLHFDPDAYEFLDPTQCEELYSWYFPQPSWYVPMIRDSLGMAVGNGVVGIYMDSPSGDCGTVPEGKSMVAELWFRVREGAPLGSTIQLQAQYADGCNGLAVPLTVDDSNSPVVDACVKSLDVDMDGCVTENDGLVIYRVLKYGIHPIWKDLVDVIPEWQRVMHCFDLPADETLIANTMALGAGLDLDEDGNVLPARDGVYFYRGSSPSFLGDIVPFEHEVDPVLPVDESTVQDNYDALDVSSCD